MKLKIRAATDRNYHGFKIGGTVLFDGTMLQTVAMGEEYLLGLLRKEPRNAFLHTRLGNLFRSAGQKEKSVPWYEQALALDAGDVEARFHLFDFAIQAGDTAALLVHGPELVAQMLKGRVTNKEELTEGIAYSVVHHLLNAPAAFKEHFLGSTPERRSRDEEIFIRTLLAQKGGAREIEADAAQRLLDGQAAPLLPEEADPTAEISLPDLDLAASLRSLVQTHGLDPEHLTVPLLTDGRRNIRVQNRHEVPVSDGKRLVHWPVASLRELFRGSRTPPADMEHYPPEYMPHFYFIENHFLTLCRAKGDRTDQAMEEIYSMLRRRPDGRSLGEDHDFLWQVAALLLGRHVLSGAEFEGLFASLTRSTRRWGIKPVSRNYAHYLETSLHDIRASSAASQGGWKVS